MAAPFNRAYNSRQIGSYGFFVSLELADWWLYSVLEVAMVSEVLGLSLLD